MNPKRQPGHVTMLVMDPDAMVSSWPVCNRYGARNTLDAAIASLDPFQRFPDDNRRV